eukprot:m.520910 g.520910  ORF g.520910 m.520910 type:complete len:329 (-) comp57497_c0_seq41:333-1319(-)
MLPMARKFELIYWASVREPRTASEANKHVLIGSTIKTKQKPEDRQGNSASDELSEGVVGCRLLRSRLSRTVISERVQRHRGSAWRRRNRWHPQRSIASRRRLRSPRRRARRGLIIEQAKVETMVSTRVGKECWSGMKRYSERRTYRTETSSKLGSAEIWLVKTETADHVLLLCALLHALSLKFTLTESECQLKLHVFVILELSGGLDGRILLADLKRNVHHQLVLFGGLGCGSGRVGSDHVCWLRSRRSKLLRTLDTLLGRRVELELGWVQCGDEAFLGGQSHLSFFRQSRRCFEVLPNASGKFANRHAKVRSILCIKLEIFEDENGF